MKREPRLKVVVKTPMIDGLFKRWTENHERRKEARKAAGKKLYMPRVLWEILGDDGKMRRMTHDEKIRAKKAQRKIMAMQQNGRLKEAWPKNAAQAFTWLQKRKLDRDKRNAKTYAAERKYLEKYGVRVRFQGARVFAQSYTGAELIIMRAERGVGRPVHA